jgi:hypothetical protein
LPMAAPEVRSRFETRRPYHYGRDRDCQREARRQPYSQVGQTQGAEHTAAITESPPQLSWFHYPDRIAKPPNRGGRRAPLPKERRYQRSTVPGRGPPDGTFRHPRYNPPGRILRCVVDEEHGRVGQTRMNPRRSAGAQEAPLRIEIPTGIDDLPQPQGLYQTPDPSGRPNLAAGPGLRGQNRSHRAGRSPPPGHELRRAVQRFTLRRASSRCRRLFALELPLFNLQSTLTGRQHLLQCCGITTKPESHPTLVGHDPAN